MMPTPDDMTMTATEEEPFAPQVAEAEQADDQFFTEIAPRGRFSSKAMNALVTSANALLPLFDQEPTYPKFDAGEIEVFPTDFTRILNMFAAASRDAAAENRIDEQLVISLEGVNDDRAVQLMAGKIKLLAKSRDFKRFLDEEAPGEAPAPEAEEPTDTDEMADDDIDALFMSRM